MAHYVVLDENNIVINGFVGKNEGENDIDWEQYYNAKRTSYNTRGGVHYDQKLNAPSVDQSKAFRKNFAGINWKYDEAKDAFIEPKPYPSWILNEETCRYDPPTPKPEGDYVWNELHRRWEAFDNS